MVARGMGNEKWQMTNAGWQMGVGVTQLRFLGRRRLLFCGIWAG